MGRGPARTDLKLRAADLLQQTQTVSTGTNGGRALRRMAGILLATVLANS